MIITLIITLGVLFTTSIIVFGIPWKAKYEKENNDIDNLKKEELKDALKEILEGDTLKNAIKEAIKESNNELNKK